MPQTGASLDDGLAAVQAMVAIARSVETGEYVRLDGRERRCLMHLGIFAKTFPRPTLEETLDAVAGHGLTHVQFNMSCAGLPTLPERIDEDLCVWIARSFRERGLTMAAISGTFNLCDPDAVAAADNLRRLDVLAAACRWLDTRIITLCTGTRDPEDMWKWHPENVRRSTWERLVASMRRGGQDRRPPRSDAGIRARDQQRGQLGRPRRGGCSTRSARRGSRS